MAARMHAVVRRLCVPSRQRAVAAAAVAALLAMSGVSAQHAPGSPMRIVLLVDSSAAISPMITQFRAGLMQFLDALPEYNTPELGLLSTGGQLRIRVAPTTDREKIRTAMSSFASDGGANAFVDSLLEADRRFLKPQTNRRSVFVILTTDAGETRSEQRIDEYNRFMRDFTSRGGRAHGIVIRGASSGVTTDVLHNLTENTGGYYDSLVIANRLQDRMKLLVDQLAADQ